MRSPFAFVPRGGPLQSASPGAAVSYLGALLLVAFLWSSDPLVLIATGAALYLAGILAGARAALPLALWMGGCLALPLVLVNALIVNRGETVLVRLGDWPLLTRDVTLEAIVAGLVIGLLVIVSALAAAVYSTCVDPDRVLRWLRPVAGRSALTATLVSRLVPVAAADARRLRDAARLRGPGAAEVGRAALARRLLAGSLDRAVDVAATLELRGYGLEAPRAGRGRKRSRYDRRFYAVAAVVLVAGVAAKLAGGDGFQTYPTVELGRSGVALALSVLVVLSGLAPLRRRPRRHRSAHSAHRATAPALEVPRV